MSALTRAQLVVAREELLDLQAVVLPVIAMHIDSHDSTRAACSMRIGGVVAYRVWLQPYVSATGKLRWHAYAGSPHVADHRAHTAAGALADALRSIRDGQAERAALVARALEALS